MQTASPVSVSPLKPAEMSEPLAPPAKSFDRDAVVSEGSLAAKESINDTITISKRFDSLSVKAEDACKSKVTLTFSPRITPTISPAKSEEEPQRSVTLAQSTVDGASSACASNNDDDTFAMKRTFSEAFSASESAKTILAAATSQDNNDEYDANLKPKSRRQWTEEEVSLRFFRQQDPNRKLFCNRTRASKITSSAMVRTLGTASASC